MEIKDKAVAKRYDVSPAFISMLKSGDKFTENRELAKAVSALTGKKAINYIPKRLQDAFSSIDPSLNDKFMWEIVLVVKHPELSRKVKRGA
jgi:hypothetical protein